MSKGPYEDSNINWTDVEVSEELARMYDSEDLTHPPYRQIVDEDEEDNMEEKEN